MEKKSAIAYVIVIFVLFTIGGFAYQQIAGKNIPSEEFLNELEQKSIQANASPTPVPFNGEKYESTEKDLRFTYPKEWGIEINTPQDGQGTYGKILDSFILTNYEPFKIVSAGLPENAVRIEGVNTLGGKDKKLETILDCAGKVISCENTEINGVSFRRSTQTLNTGNMLIQLASKNQDKLYIFTITISEGNMRDQNLHTVEKIIDSIVIIK